MATDAAEICALVRATPALDPNSAYAYLLLCTHFADTGLVAYAPSASRGAGGSELVGFVLGYSRPDEGRTAFVWQVAVSEAARGRRLGARLLDAWFARCARRSDSRFLEATVTPSNRASRALFSSFARRHCAPIRERLEFPSKLFPDDSSHEDEISIRIGPVPLSRAIEPKRVIEGEGA